MRQISEWSSADPQVHQVVESQPEKSTAFARYPTQANKCPFGSTGICCRLCANGPCRITEKSPRGVCGADRDTIVARNFLRSVAAGTACYLHVAENAATALKQAPGDADPRALTRLARRLGIDPAGQSIGALAATVAQTILDDLYRPRTQTMELVARLAPKTEYARWTRLGLLPGGAKAEVFDALVKTSTNLNSHVPDMLLHCLRLGIVTGYHGLILTNAVNDALLGDPQIVSTTCGLGVINHDMLNLAVTGHQQAVANRRIRQLMDAGLEQAARRAGAMGVRVVGLTCVGQDMQSRNRADDPLFAGHAGDNFTAEAALLTGGIDLLVSDFNCTIPGLDVIAAEDHIPELCADDVARLPNALTLTAENTARETLDKIIAGAVAHFTGRKGKKPSPAGTTAPVLTGLTAESLVDYLGGSLQPVLDLIKAGRIRGLAGVVGCSNLRGGHGVLTEQLTRELIRRDVLVLTAGCTSGVLGNRGLLNPDAAKLAGPNLQAVCREANIPPVLNFGPCLGIGRIEQVAHEAACALGIEISQLPVAISAPQWLEEQALADGSFALALGLSLHLGTAPAVTGSDQVVDVLLRQVKELTGGCLHIEPEAEKAAEWMTAVIDEKRRQLGLC